MLLAAFAGSARAQQSADTLFAQVSGNRLLLSHTVAKGENLEQIAARYHLTPGALAAQNGIAFASALFEGAEIRIPLDTTNLSESFGAGDRPVYFRCRGRENFEVLATSIGQNFRKLQALNPGMKQYCTPGNLVLIGYFRKPAATADEIIPEKDGVQPVDTPTSPPVDSFPVAPVPEPVVPEAEALFKEAVEAGMPLVTHTGPVSFFPGGSGTVYYAFHNAAAHGTILRIHNPANGRVVYAKVIGRVPGSRNFYKALAGVSDNARQALGSLGDARLWCEVSYAGY